MTRTTRWTLLALALSAVLGWTTTGSRADDAKEADDLKKMQGTWVNDGEGPDLKWVIKDDSLKASVNGQEYTCKIVLDSKAKPATADIKISDGPGDTAGKTSKAIYKFDGEKLVFCITHPGGENRPSEFKATEDESFLFTLKQEK